MKTREHVAWVAIQVSLAIRPDACLQFIPMAVIAAHRAAVCAETVCFCTVHAAASGFGADDLRNVPRVNRQLPEGLSA